MKHPALVAIALLVGLAVGLLLGRTETSVAWSAGSDRTAPSPPARPYKIMSGQSGDDFQVFYILDQDLGRLVVAQWEGERHGELEILEGRDLADDFNRQPRGAYSMAKI